MEDGAVVEEEEEEEAEVEEVENVTSAVKSGISPVLALRLVEGRTAPSTEAGVVAVRKRLGACFFFSTSKGVLLAWMINCHIPE